MAAFTITGAAKLEIQARLESSRCERAVASLLDGSQSWVLPNEAAEALERVTTDEHLAFARKQYDDRKSSLDFRLEVGIYEADECRPQDLAPIDGLPFAMPEETRAYFGDYVLDFVDGQFILRNGQRIFVRLMDLGTEHGGAV